MARIFAILAFGLLASTASVRAGVVQPASSEFQVSRGRNAGYYNYEDGQTQDVDVSRAPSGDFIVVWEEIFGAEYGYRVAARRMHRDGSAAGGQFPVFQVPDNQGYSGTFRPSVAATTNDGFVVVWANKYEDPALPENPKVWAQRYDASNNPVGARIPVNTSFTDTNDYNRTGVAAAPDGGFLVVWDDYDVNARRFDATGVPLTPQFTVNTDPVGTYEFPGVDSNANGDFIVVWRDYSGDGMFTNGIFGQRLDADANFVGGEFQVSEYGDAWRNRAAVAPDGTVMVLGWPYGPEHDLTARIYDPSGNPTTDEFDIDLDADMFGVDADPDGNFVIVWRTYPGYVVKGRRYSPAGTALDDVFTVSERPQNGVFDPTASFPDVATDDAGDFVVVWNNNYYGYYGEPYQYRNLMGAWARRMAVCGNGRVGPDDACDDGNTTPLDGCSATCRVETCHACTGDPSVCGPLAGCAAVCTDPAPIQPSTAILTFKGLGAPTGDEGLVFKGKVANPPLQHLEYDPSIEGAELALTTTGTVYALAGTTRIPGGLLGTTGCDPTHDGWKAKPGSYVYKNASGALPPACTPGSANGVRVLKIKDKLDRDGTLLFRVKARNATIGLTPQPPLIATLVLGQSPGAGAAGRCGQITFTGVLGSRFFP